MVKRFNNFFGDYIFENMINESIIYYSPDTRKILTRLKDNEIAQDLLSVEATDVKPDITFVNLDKEGYLSFITMRNASKLIKDKHSSFDNFENIPNIDAANALWRYKDDSSVVQVYNTSRNLVKVGKLVNKVFPGKYPDAKIEDFVNKFKSTIESSGERFILVSGGDIDFWYDYENYQISSRGSLGNSCMKAKRGIFTIYTENPDVCKMLCLIEDEKLIGRALVWKLDTIKRHTGSKVEGVEWFMDRQYVQKDSDVEKFRTYAKNAGWAYKAYNNHHNFSTINFGEEFGCDMTVKVKAKDYRRYPYMDTFRRYDKDAGILYNDSSSDSDYSGHYILASTDGGFEEIESGRWSEWQDRYIDEDNAVWSDWADSYLDIDYAREIRTGSRRHRGWYPDDCEEITYDEWMDEWIHQDDAVYSERYGYSIFSDNAVKFIEKVFSDGSIEEEENFMHKDDENVVDLSDLTSTNWYKFVSDKWSEWNDFDGILLSEMTIDYQGNYIPKRMSRTAYKVLEPGELVDITGVDYLMKVDANTLETQIDLNDSIIIDIVRYNQRIAEFIEPIKGQLSTKITQLKLIISGEGRLKFEDDAEYLQKIEKLKSELSSRLEELEDEIWHEE
jgi:hypothetical protein